MTSEQSHLNDDDSSLQSSTIALHDGDIYVALNGPTNAPPLVLIHGSASSSRAWDPMVPWLAESHRVIRIDLLGHGRSSKPVGPSYRPPEQSSRVGKVLDQLGIEHAIVAGHSSGGIIATSLAVQRPELVTALVLINTGPGMNAFIAPQSAAIDPSQWPPSDEQLHQFASAGFSRPGYQVPQEALDEIRQMTHHTLTASMQGATEYLQQETLPERLSSLGLPLLVIFGEDDRRWRSASAADYRAVPGAMIKLLPGLGHSPILEDPQRTAELLLEFSQGGSS